MKKLFAFTLIALSTLSTVSHAIERCDARFNSLYKEIQIYNRTEKLTPGFAQVGPMLENQMKYLSPKLSEKEKVQALETGFAKCDPQLSDQDQLEIEITEE